MSKQALLMQYRGQMTTPFLRQLVASGMAGQLIARGVPGGFVLVMKDSTGSEHVLAAQRGDPRVFRRLDTLVGYLKDLGVPSAVVEIAAWDGGETPKA